MNILTNEDNPNTLKLIIAAKVVQQSVTVKKIEPKGRVFPFQTIHFLTI